MDLISLIALAAMLAVGLLAGLWLAGRSRQSGADSETARAALQAEAMAQAENQAMRQALEQMSRQQNEMAGRLASFAEAQEAARGELTRTLSEQLIQVSNNVNQNLKDSREKTTKSLGDLGAPVVD